MSRKGLKHHIVLALYENDKAMSRLGIWGELPEKVAPKSIDSMSTALTYTKKDGHIRSAGADTWEITSQGVEYAEKHVEKKEAEA